MVVRAGALASCGIMTDSATNSCSWSDVTDDSLPLDVELTFPAIGAPVTSQNALETVELTSHMDQNRPNIDTYAAGVRPVNGYGNWEFAVAPPQSGYSSTEIWIELEFANVSFLGEGNPEYPEKNLSEQRREPTTNSTHILHRVR